MQEYPVKRGLPKTIDLSAMCVKHFGRADQEGEWVTSSFGALNIIKVRYEGGTKLVVDTQQDRSPNPETAMKTIRAWNVFLEAATGYNAKQRGKKAQEAAKKDGR